MTMASVFDVTFNVVSLIMSECSPRLRLSFVWRSSSMDDGASMGVKRSACSEFACAVYAGCRCGMQYLLVARAMRLGAQLMYTVSRRITIIVYTVLACVQCDDHV